MRTRCSSAGSGSASSTSSPAIRREARSIAAPARDAASRHAVEARCSPLPSASERRRSSSGTVMPTTSHTTIRARSSASHATTRTGNGDRWPKRPRPARRARFAAFRALRSARCSALRSARSSCRDRRDGGGTLAVGAAAPPRASASATDEARVSGSGSSIASSVRTSDAGVVAGTAFATSMPRPLCGRSSGSQPVSSVSAVAPMP